ncbi:MAG: ASPIC/UnbV domain-containing protein, partial [Bacteroidota bacterium]
ICIQLEGTVSNRAAIGARIEVKFRENGAQRSVYRDVNSGGSFGCSPLRREIGIGKAVVIDEINIRWQATNEVQTFMNVKSNQFLKIKEGETRYTTKALKILDFKQQGSKMPMCKPDTIISQVR